MLGLSGQPPSGRLEIHQVESKTKHGAGRPGPRPDLHRRRLRLCLGNGPGARRGHCSPARPHPRRPSPRLGLDGGSRGRKSRHRPLPPEDESDSARRIAGRLRPFVRRRPGRRPGARWPRPAPSCPSRSRRPARAARSRHPRPSPRDRRLSRRSRGRPDAIASSAESEVASSTFSECTDGTRTMSASRYRSRMASGPCPPRSRTFFSK